MNLLYENLNDIKIISRNFLKWFVLSLISGIGVGTVITLFLKAFNMQLMLEKIMNGCCIYSLLEAL